MKALIFYFVLIFSIQAAKKFECKGDAECALIWPESTCKRGLCKCPSNFIRRASLSRGWVCLSLEDSVTGQLGPPITCPLPSGTGYRLVLKDSNSSVVFCHTKNSPNICGDQYECIRTIGVLNAENDGVCCPNSGKVVLKLI
jgi:hypothetical protein